MDLAGRVWEIWGVGWWENVYNLFNSSGRRCGIIENRKGDGEVKSFWANSLFVCVTISDMVLFILKSIYGNVNSIYCHMVIKTKRR